MRKTHLLISIAALALGLLGGSPAVAATVRGHSGELPATAQRPATEVVSSISGSTGSVSDVDGYKGCLVGGATFSASTIGGTTPDTCQLPDRTPPTIDLRSPVDGLRVEVGTAVEVDFSCSDEGGSELASCEGSVPDEGYLDTSAVGPASVTVRARDNAGNETVVSHGVEVAYEFSWEVVGPRGWGVWRAGKPLRVRFSLNGAHGRDAVQSIDVAEVECGAGEQPAAGEPARIVKGLDVRYRPLLDAYVFLWRTERAWAGSCRQLILGLDDGSVRRGDFRFVARGPEAG
jgi:hypothetical protein